MAMSTCGEYSAIAVPPSCLLLAHLCLKFRVTSSRAGRFFLNIEKRQYYIVVSIIYTTVTMKGFKEIGEHFFFFFCQNIQINT